jgi:hypothetical protein
MGDEENHTSPRREPACHGPQESGSQDGACPSSEIFPSNALPLLLNISHNESQELHVCIPSDQQLAMVVVFILLSAQSLQLDRFIIMSEIKAENHPSIYNIRTGGMAQTVAPLPTKHEAQSSNPSTARC